MPSQIEIAEINYPANVNTDKLKLEAVYRLLENLRIEHNKIGVIAKDDFVKHIGRWQTYKKHFNEKQVPILMEQRRLKNLIRDVNYSKSEWETADIIDSDYELLFGDKQTSGDISTLATNGLIDELKAIDFLKLTGVYVDPFEDWTGYIETDTSNILTVIANKITIVDLTRSTDSWVENDFGASHFGTTGIDHDISSEASTFNNNSDPVIYIWGLSNDSQVEDNADPMIVLRMQDRAGSLMRYRIEIDDGAVDEIDQSINLSLSTRYFDTILRESTGTDVKVYSDSDRTTLLDTLSVSQGSSSFQFMAQAFSKPGSGSSKSSGIIYDLDLNEAAAPAAANIRYRTIIT